MGSESISLIKIALNKNGVYKITSALSHTEISLYVNDFGTRLEKI